MKDEIVIGGMLLLITLVCLATFSVVVLHNAFDPMGFGTGAAAVLGAMGGGIGARDWMQAKGESYAVKPIDH